MTAFLESTSPAYRCSHSTGRASPPPTSDVCARVENGEAAAALYVWRTPDTKVPTRPRVRRRSRLETLVFGGQHAHVKSCGQSVGTAHLDDSPTSFPTVLERSESVSFPLHTIALNGLASSGKPLTTAAPTSETERDGTTWNGPDRDRPRRTSIWPKMAVTVGFEPTVGGYPTQLFESCTFGRSDTSPPTSLRHVDGCRESAPTGWFRRARWHRGSRRRRARARRSRPHTHTSR